MGVFTSDDFHHHELVVYCSDEESGLRAIIAIHNTSLGPALGGCRIYPYACEEEALKDVLRLSGSMTYKAALAHLPLGGGKAVIIADPKVNKTPEKLRAFAHAVNRLGGRYITAEDVGSSVEDMNIIRSITEYVVGSDAGSGDPSPFTAYGVLVGFKATLAYLNRPDLKGLRVALQGVGHVGYHLCRLLVKEGAQLIVTDVDKEAVERVAQECNVTYVEPHQIYQTDVDVFSPCALGGTLNAQTIPQLKAKMVIGCANNQLATPQDGVLLKQRDIFYAPDYVINAGGLINVYYESRTYDVARVHAHIDKTQKTLEEIYDLAKEQDISHQQAADQLAQYRLRQSSGTTLKNV